MIQVENLTKNYISKKLFQSQVVTPVIESLDLCVQPGEIQGLVGPNGAGKTTLVKILCGLQRATTGDVQVCGLRPESRSRDFYQQIGVVFGHKNSLWWDLPLMDSFHAAKAIYNVHDDQFNSNFEELVECLQLRSILSKPVRVLSLGERVKSEIACTLLHNPKVLFLDEPTIGLDLESKFQLRQYLARRAKEQNMAILLTSHDMGDVEGLCDRVALIYDRKLQINVCPQKLREQFSLGSSESLESVIMRIFKGGITL